MYTHTNTNKTTHRHAIASRKHDTCRDARHGDLHTRIRTINPCARVSEPVESWLVLSCVRARCLHRGACHECVCVRVCLRKRAPMRRYLPASSFSPSVIQGRDCRSCTLAPCICTRDAPRVTQTQEGLIEILPTYLWSVAGQGRDKKRSRF